MAFGVYDDHGIRYTTVPGTSWTGLYASDGSINVVLDDTTHFGLYHSCGALRASSTLGNTIYDPTGAYYLNRLYGGAAPVSGESLPHFTILF